MGQSMHREKLWRGICRSVRRSISRIPQACRNQATQIMGQSMGGDRMWICCSHQEMWVCRGHHLKNACGALLTRW